MRDYVIVTDNAADLDEGYRRDNNIAELFMDYSIDGVLYSSENQLPAKVFYDKVRKGAMPTTMAANPESVRAVFEKIVEEGHDILTVSFSSGMSSTCSNYQLAAQAVMEQHPEAKIIIVDSLSSCGGEALQVINAQKFKDQGLSLEDNAAWLTAHALNFSHYFTVDDLFHLFRGGRLSRTAAIVGTLASVKPLLYINNEGKLDSFGRTHGRRKSVEALADMYDRYATKELASENDTVYICHGDCEKDADLLASLVQKKAPDKKIIVHTLSTVVGTHGGPGILTLHFLCDKRI
jgi:DegV family protein with EDD domain